MFPDRPMSYAKRVTTDNKQTPRIISCHCRDMETTDRKYRAKLLKNIGTPSVQELFFCDRSISRAVYSNDLFKIFGCDVQQERNWEDSKHLEGTSGDDSSALIEFTPL